MLLAEHTEDATQDLDENGLLLLEDVNPGIIRKLKRVDETRVLFLVHAIERLQLECGSLSSTHGLFLDLPIEHLLEDTTRSRSLPQLNV